MSKAKDFWYGKAVALIRDYPRCAKHPTCERDQEDAAIIEAVISDFEQEEQGRFTLTIIEAVDWKGGKCCDIVGASERTAKRYRRKFIEAVAERVGWRKVGTKTPKNCA